VGSGEGQSPSPAYRVTLVGQSLSDMTNVLM